MDYDELLEKYQTILLENRELKALLLLVKFAVPRYGKDK